MERTKQDKEWNNLKPEYQELERKMYLNMKQCSIKGYWDEFIKTKEEQFGVHNLNPQPQIKTWEDVDNNTKSIIQIDGFDTAFREILDIHITTHHLSTKLAYKIIATIQIAKLIDLGYGGRISSSEWEDVNCSKYAIEYCPQDSRRFVELDYCVGQYRFIAFHTAEQRREFMSYEENRSLVEKYFML